MERVEFDYPIAYRGYEIGIIDDVLEEKDRIIDIQGKDLESLKREIVDSLPAVDAEGVDDDTIYMVKVEGKEYTIE